MVDSMIIVMGLPGAGKSTVLAAAAKTDYKLVNYGDLMFDIASKTRTGQQLEN